MKIRAAFLLTFVFIAAFCFAEMTLWYKNGTSILVYKIVFQGEIAEVFLMDGTVRKVRVDQIDLKSSGISKPVGTYGGQGKAPPRIPLTTPPTQINSETRQQQLKEEWDRAERKAVALNDAGAIRRGDVVHIVNETAQPETKKKNEYSDYYTPPPPPKDDAYLVIYRNPDGSYAKKLFDAVTFVNNFRIEKDPEKKVTMPVEPRIPEDKDKPVDSTTPAPAPVETKQPALAPPPVLEQASQEETEPGPPVWPIMLAVVLIAAATVIVVILRKRPKGFVNSSKFSHFEEELRDFEIEIWLKHGKTMEQLVDVCVKKFYADQPGPLSAMSKIQKGQDKNTVIAFISKQGNMGAPAAGRIQAEMTQRLDWIRNTIQEVSRRTGRMPLPETRGGGAPTGIMVAPLPKQPVSQPQPPVEEAPAGQKPPPTGVMSWPGRSNPPQATSPAARPPVASPPGAAAGQTGMPSYLENVMRDLALLSETRED